MLELQDVSIFNAGTVLIRPFSLVIEPGETVTLMGPSGAGKSSLLSFIGGSLEKPFDGQGRTSLAGRPLNNLPPEQRRIARLFQDDLLFPHMTVAENLLFAVPAMERTERLRRVAEALKQMELAGFEARAPHTLSGGQRARVALARAMLSAPAAILLDEPFGKLDAVLKASIRALTFATIAERKMPALLVTHDRADAPEGGRVFAITATGEVKDA